MRRDVEVAVPYRTERLRMSVTNDAAGKAFEKLALQFGKLEKAALDEARKRVLPQAGKIIQEYQLGVIATEGLVDTGQLRDAVRVKVFDDRVNVGQSGRRRESARRTRTNALTGAMLDLGEEAKPDKKGKGWITRANEAAADDVFRLAEETLGQILDEVF